MLIKLTKKLVEDLLFLLDIKYIRSTAILTRIALKKQYRESFLGLLWTLIQPTIQITVLCFVFSFLMKVPVSDYSKYVMGGMLPWTLLTASLVGGANSLIAKAGLIKGGTVLPRTMFVFSDILVQVYIFFISFVAIYLVIGTFFADISISILWWPVVVIPLIGTCIFAGTAFAYLAPYVRDIGYLIVVLMNVLFWTIPIAYPASMVSPDRHIYFEINPFYILIKPVQYLVHSGSFPGLMDMVRAFIVMILSAFAAWIIHRKMRQEVVYYL